MKSGCEGQKVKKTRSISLPVIAGSADQKEGIRKSKTSRWRAVALITLTLLMVAHVIQWRIMGTTVSPIEPSETMYTLQQGAINAGFIFFSLAIVATLVFGRFVCGWGCHIVALQDFCAWLLKKLGLTPKPFRSRLLVYVPLIAALYMFVWPTVGRYFTKPPNEPLIPQFTNHLITTDFWATFPPVLVAIPFLFICGFVTVYFLGQKGFCTYGCPYGGVFVLADKVAPGKIRVTDACNQCGHCTATCMANVQVHAEIAKYGMVIDPGCMKHMDCISVCPNDALYFGFGKPTVAAMSAPGTIATGFFSNSKSKTQNPKSARPAEKNYSLTWPEETFGAAVFLASFMAVWDVYQLVPMLMALGIAPVTTFLALKSSKLVRTKDSTFYRFNLRSGGTIRKAGWAFLSFAVLWTGLNAHSGWIRYNERAGAIAFDSLRIPDELALAQGNPSQWLNASDQASIGNGRDHLNAAAKYGLFTNSYALPKLAWFEYLSGNPERAVQILDFVAEHQDGQPKALSLYYRGAVLNRLGRYDEALTSLDQALTVRPDLVLAREEKGESLWRLSRREDAINVWGEAVRSNPALPVANTFLAGASALMGRSESSVYQKQADQYTPNDPYFHWMLGLRLEGIGMKEPAEKHFQRAIQLDPRFRSRRNR
jgi:polyferredoxin/Flp pilus assembly protein TadD